MQAWPDFETILVDQTATHRPDTVKFLERVASRIRHVKLDHPSVTVACNVGAGVATGEILVFLDDDIRILGDSLLARHADRFRDPSIGVVAGRVRNPARPQRDCFDPRSGEPIWGWYHSAWDHETETDLVTAPGANMSCRKDLFIKLDGFDERFTGNAVRFENDFCLRIRGVGYRVIFEPAAEVVHHYDSEGGHNNRHLYGTSEESHAWYVSYFRNMVYMTVKHMPIHTWPLVCWRLWRQHVCNRPFLRQGWRFVYRRHRMFMKGFQEGFQVGRGNFAHGGSHRRAA
jgi:GT2 family glycosyltransferase